MDIRRQTANENFEMGEVAEGKYQHIAAALFEGHLVQTREESDTVSF